MPKTVYVLMNLRKKRAGRMKERKRERKVIAQK